MKGTTSLLGLFFLASTSSFVVTASAVMAQDTADTANKPPVACLQPSERMSNADIQAFTGNPSGVLKSNPDGGLALNNSVRSIAGSNSETLSQVMALLTTATASQKAAIAAGLARVVYACGNIHSEDAQNYAAKIQGLVANSGDPEFASTFQKAAQDINVASVAAGQTGGVGGGAINSDSLQPTSNQFRYVPSSLVKVTTQDLTIGTTNSFYSPTR